LICGTKERSRAKTEKNFFKEGVRAMYVSFTEAYTISASSSTIHTGTPLRSATHVIALPNILVIFTLRQDYIISEKKFKPFYHFSGFYDIHTFVFRLQ